MKKGVYILATTLLVLFAYSCSNELVLIDDKEEISIVFGFLSSTDTAQYVRIQRAFVDPEISALEIAKNPDSLYYKDLDVKLIHNNTGNEYSLKEVDGNLEGYVKEEGVFAQSPNTLYKILTDSIELIEDDSYTIKINRGDKFSVVEATTVFVPEPKISKPNDDATFSFPPIGDAIVKWKPEDNLKVFDVNFYFNIKQQDLTKPTEPFKDTIIVWNAGRNIIPSPYQLNIEGNKFFQYMVGALEANENIRRRFVTFDVEIVGAGSELVDYINVAQANLGITSSQEIPSYTNMSEGLGIFSSRNTTRNTNIRLTPSTLDSLINGNVTSSLNFE